MQKSTQPGLKLVKYRKPTLSGLRGISALASTDTLSVIVQTLGPGARQGLHAHGAYDGFYFALAGRARFYGEGNALFAEIGPGEAVFVPRGTVYGFEAADGEVELLAIDGIDKTAADSFIAAEPGSDLVRFELFSAEGDRLGGHALEMRPQRSQGS